MLGDVLEVPSHVSAAGGKRLVSAAWCYVVEHLEKGCARLAGHLAAGHLQLLVDIRTTSDNIGRCPEGVLALRGQDSGGSVIVVAHPLAYSPKLLGREGTAERGQVHIHRAPRSEADFAMSLQDMEDLFELPFPFAARGKNPGDKLYPPCPSASVEPAPDRVEIATSGLQYCGNVTSSTDFSSTSYISILLT
jgi:hypothetical protein